MCNQPQQQQVGASWQRQWDDRRIDHSNGEKPESSKVGNPGRNWRLMSARGQQRSWLSNRHTHTDLTLALDVTVLRRAQLRDLGRREASSRIFTTRQNPPVSLGPNWVAGRRGLLGWPGRGDLYSPNEHKDDNNQKDQPQAASRIIAPASAMRPSRQCAEKREEENHNQNTSKHVFISLS